LYQKALDEVNIVHFIEKENVDMEKKEAINEEVLSKWEKKCYKTGYLCHAKLR
jgi:hypothetical protein